MLNLMTMDEKELRDFSSSFYCDLLKFEYGLIQNRTELYQTALLGSSKPENIEILSNCDDEDCTAEECEVSRVEPIVWLTWDNLPYRVQIQVCQNLTSLIHPLSTGFLDPTTPINPFWRYVMTSTHRYMYDHSYVDLKPLRQSLSSTQFNMYTDYMMDMLQTDHLRLYPGSTVDVYPNMDASASFSRNDFSSATFDWGIAQGTKWHSFARLCLFADPQIGDWWRPYAPANVWQKSIKKRFWTNSVLANVPVIGISIEEVMSLAFDLMTFMGFMDPSARFIVFSDTIPYGTLGLGERFTEAEMNLPNLSKDRQEAYERWMNYQRKISSIVALVENVKLFVKTTEDSIMRLELARLQTEVERIPAPKVIEYANKYSW